MNTLDNAEQRNVRYIDKNKLIWDKLKIGSIIEYSVKVRKDERVKKVERNKSMRIIFKSRNMIVGRSKNYNNSYCFNDLVTRDVDITKIYEEVL